MDAVTLDQVDVAYGRHRALEDVTLTIEAGTSVALVGPNGSGKTTLLHLMAGLLAPSSGAVDVAGSTSYVLQHSGAGNWIPLTVEEVLRMGRYPDRGLLARLRRDDQRILAEAAARLEVEHLRARQFGELSGGQRQRVLVAQALAQNADVVLMDEPITGLDFTSQERILEVIEQETDRGHTVVLSTHNLDEAHHCDLVAVLSGRLVAFGPPTVALNADILREAYDDTLFGAHRDHDHPTGVVLLDDHHHDHDHHHGPA